MTYRSILMPLEHGARSAERLGGALAFARSMDAHVVAVAASNLEYGLTPQALLSKAKQPKLVSELLLERAGNAALRFEIACRLEKISSFESFVVESASADAIAQHMHACDLLVLQQPDPQAEHYAVRCAALHASIRASSKPVLVMPHAAGVAPLADRVLVAWDGSQNASRSIADALPILRRAHRVDVITWTGCSASARERAEEEAGGIRGWLASHGVDAHSTVETADSNIADALLARVNALGSDMIVMGTGSSAPVLERILGSASQRVLCLAGVPVFMSH